MRRATLLSCLAFVAGCGDDEPPEQRPGMRSALGGEARVETLAREQLAKRPAGEVAWSADELRLEPGKPVTHRHELAFVYGRRGDSNLAPEREAVVVADGVEHEHAALGGDAVIWEIRLAAPGTGPVARARRIFASDPLEGIPPQPLASFLIVTVPPHGGETTIHTHPGPEFIYQFEGRIEYQNALIGTEELGPGGAEGIPPGTAVQKRNPFAEDASFLSWFLVDPGEPFASDAEF